VVVNLELFLVKFITNGGSREDVVIYVMALI